MRASLPKLQKRDPSILVMSNLWMEWCLRYLDAPRQWKVYKPPCTTLNSAWRKSCNQCTSCKISPIYLLLLISLERCYVGHAGWALSWMERLVRSLHCLCIGSGRETEMVLSCYSLAFLQPCPEHCCDQSVQEQMRKTGVQRAVRYLLAWLQKKHYSWKCDLDPGL